MAGRIRSIKPEILEDEKTAGLSHEAFRLFIGMITLADDYGNVRCAPARLHGSIFWATEDAEAVVVTRKALEELVGVGLVWRYSVSGQTYAHLAGWSKHQRVDKPGPPRCPKHTDTCAIREPLANDSRGAREPLVTDQDPDQDPDQDQEGDQDPTTQVASDPPAGEAPSEEARVVPEPPAEAMECAVHLLQAIRSHAPDYAADEVRLRRWAKDLDLAMRRDGRTMRQLKWAADYAHRTTERTFWRANILSGRKLREHCERLGIEARARANQLKGPGGARAGLTPAQLLEAADRMEREDGR